MRDFKIIGHRGACAHEPENTLRSILRAIADGADMVEIDVRYAAGEILVIHDSTLDRTTNGRGPIHKASFAEIRALDAGCGEKIPTLAEVIEITRGKVPLNIELKEPAVIDPVCDLLEDYGISGSPDLLLSSSNGKTLKKLRARLPIIPIGIIFSRKSIRHEPMFALAAQVQANSIHPHLARTSATLIEAAHARNLQVMPYTVRTRNQLQKLLAVEADGCFADDPRWAAGVVRDYRKGML